jgi:hypothetical protein
MSIDLQNAFALSRLEYKSTCQGKKIKELTSQGKYVVGYSIDIHCRYTDAVLGSEDVIVSVHDTKEEAEDHIGEDNEGLFMAEPRLNTEEPEIVTAKDTCCPF